MKRIYVEPFAIKDGSGKFRDDVIAQLRKVKSLTVVPDRSAADAVLSGDGEIWIKGYQSLNPRSGRLPFDGTPVYSGFLSLELKDVRGDTLWSYLVRQGAGSTNISRDLSKQIAKHLADALAPNDESAQQIPAQSVTSLKGAGATFPYPIYTKWFANYGRQNSNVAITYEAVGSEAGIRQLLNGKVDFGASDNPAVLHEIAPADEDKYLFFPSVIGAVVPIVNLPGLPSDINFTPEALAGIYLGKIKKWNDPLLKSANRGVTLPDLDIVVVHRADGSGTSYAWTDYLSKTNSEWREQVGPGMMPPWPVGRAANGNDGVAKLVKELGGSIGYVEFIYALRNHLSVGKVQNGKGRFLAADLENVAAAATGTDAPAGDFKISLVNAPAADAYPIASFTWFLIPAHMEDDAKRRATKDFLAWMLGPGQKQVAALGYIALPHAVIAAEQAALAKID